MSRIEFGLKKIVRFFAKLVKTHGFIAGINTSLGLDPSQVIFHRYFDRKLYRKTENCLQNLSDGVPFQ